jgi:hypothetical protein
MINGGKITTLGWSNWSSVHPPSAFNNPWLSYGRSPSQRTDIVIFRTLLSFLGQHSRNIHPIYTQLEVFHQWVLRLQPLSKVFQPTAPNTEG